MFAGPHGSGKSTIKRSLPSELLGYYLNPDELEMEIHENLRLDLSLRGIQADEPDLAGFLDRSVLARQNYSDDELKQIVMSHIDKVQFLRTAQLARYRTYLYYVATEDPEINISRVRNRVALGGHNVAPDKVFSRYHRSLDLLLGAIKNSNRAYIFDNSGAAGEHFLVAEVTTLKLSATRSQRGSRVLFSTKPDKMVDRRLACHPMLARPNP